MREFGGVLPKAPANAPQPIAALPLGHLWFLYDLMIFYVFVLTIRAVVRAVDRRHVLRSALDRLVSASLNACFASLLVAVPVGLSLLTLPTWAYIQGIPTPDQSLVPTLPAFIGYATAVSFGFVLQRQPGNLKVIQRRWLPQLLIALVATAVCFKFLGTQSPISPVVPGTARIVYALAYGIAAWSWTLAITGAALTFCAGHSPARRYLADASYWMYLVHLPLVAGIGVCVGHWPISWGIKYPLTLAVSLLLLLVSYHYLARPTFIGEQLNGRRYPIRKAAAAAPEAGARAP
jgi:peptidoglycan/LPS O-acetylase OafA/YrhL